MRMATDCWGEVRVSASMAMLDVIAQPDEELKVLAHGVVRTGPSLLAQRADFQRLYSPSIFTNRRGWSRSR